MNGTMRDRYTIHTGLAVFAAVFGAGLTACGGRGALDDVPAGLYSNVPFYAHDGVGRVDLLLMIDNSSSMRENQANLLAQLGFLVRGLAAPPCASRSNPTPHACDPSNASDFRIAPPVWDLHVGVVSSDLGTPGTSVPGCFNSDLGDDGQLNPIRNGAALSHHEPWTAAPPIVGRPTDCMDPNQFPSFLYFDSGTSDATMFDHDFRCYAGLGVGGCGLESQLDSVYRALVVHDATDRPGNTSSNAGFLRENALLAIVMLTDEEDGSVMDCRFANGEPCDGVGAINVYSSGSTAWSSTGLNLRFYMYAPCTAQDPTWPLERYLDPARPTAGLLGLKPGHPERVIFAAITGVPLAVPMTGAGSSARVDWNALLGAPGPAGADDFCHRDSSMLSSLTSAEGPISMAQANWNPACPLRVVPACRRAGSTYDPAACALDQQYFAWPARRIVEVARRFDQSPICNGLPCHNGMVASICGADYTAAVSQIVAKIQSRLSPPCGLEQPLDLMSVADPTGANRTLVEVDCNMYEAAPEGVASCDSTHGRIEPARWSGAGGPVQRFAYLNRHVCVVQQLAVDTATGHPADPTLHGWFYDTHPPPPQDACAQAITFTSDDGLRVGSVVQFECVQRF